MINQSTFLIGCFCRSASLIIPTIINHTISIHHGMCGGERKFVFSTDVSADDRRYF
jgi:ribosomal protein S19